MAIAKLTVLTPVHIGSGEKLQRDFDFIIKEGKVGFLDLKKVVAKIGMERLPQLTAEIEKKSVKSYLERTIPTIPIEDLCKRIATNQAPNSNCNELKEQYFTSLLNACIPGSSIKGAIKTALWESIATKATQSRWQTAEYKNHKGKFDSNNLDNKLFGGNANEKTTRFLKIGDVQFPETTTLVTEIGIINAEYNDWKFKKGSSFLAECIPSGANSTFQLKLDEEWLKLNKKYNPNKWEKPSTALVKKDIKAFCSLLNSYIIRLINYEFEDLETAGFDYNKSGKEMLDELKRIRNIADHAAKNQSNFAILRVGGNSGWNFTTGGWVKASPLPENEYNNLRRAVQRRSYNMDLWPKTRKMTMKGIPLGFVKIEFKD